MALLLMSPSAFRGVARGVARGVVSDFCGLMGFSKSDKGYRYIGQDVPMTRFFCTLPHNKVLGAL